jgi:hypothetical protein
LMDSFGHGLVFNMISQKIESYAPDAPAVQTPSASSAQPVTPQTVNEPTITQAPSSFTPAQAEEEIKVTKL